MKKAVFFTVCSLVLFAAHEAAAQPLPWAERVYVNLNVGFQSSSDEFTDQTTRSVYGETATFSTAQSIDAGGSLIDFSAGARVWQNATVGIGYHHTSSSSDATAQGSVPHPLFRNQLRTFTTSVSDLERSESAVHLQFGYMFIVSEKISAHLMLGPSFFKLHQDVISDVSFTEGAGNTTVSGTTAVAQRDDSPVGFNFGVDVTYQVVQVDRAKIGAGLLLRYAAAKADVLLMQNTVETDLGGFQFGIGARVRF
jgi:hypothetical protein